MWAYGVLNSFLLFRIIFMPQAGGGGQSGSQSQSQLEKRCECSHRSGIKLTPSCAHTLGNKALLPAGGECRLAAVICEPNVHRCHQAPAAAPRLRFRVPASPGSAHLPNTASPTTSIILLPPPPAPQGVPPACCRSGNRSTLCPCPQSRFSLAHFCAHGPWCERPRRPQSEDPALWPCSPASLSQGPHVTLGGSGLTCDEHTRYVGSVYQGGNPSLTWGEAGR